MKGRETYVAPPCYGFSGFNERLREKNEALQLEAMTSVGVCGEMDHTIGVRA